MNPTPFIRVQDLVGMLIPTLGLSLVFWFFSNGRFPITPSLCIAGLIAIGMLAMSQELQMPLLLLAFLVMCFVYPPMIGLGIGIGGYCLLWRAVHRGMWGE